MTTVLDTNALLRWTHAPERLSEPARRVLAQPADAPFVLCSMSLWEIAWKQRLGKLDLGMSAGEYAKRLERLPLRIVAVDVELWLANVALDWSHRDPVDRTIVALASGLGATLLTSDREITAFYDRALW